jgi:hypothetical protein
MEEDNGSGPSVGYKGGDRVQPVLVDAVFPTKPIEVIVPYTARGTNDRMARLVAEVSKKYLKQPLVIFNKPGSGGSLGVAEALQAPPDGYKLVSIATNYFSTIAYAQKISFDPAQLVPVVNFMQYRNGLIVKGNSPFMTFNDLLVYGRKTPASSVWLTWIVAVPYSYKPIWPSNKRVYKRLTPSIRAGQNASMPSYVAMSMSRRSHSVDLVSISWQAMSGI